MGRSTKKGPYVDEKLVKKIQLLNKNGEKKVVRTWARASMITPEFVGHTVAIHNGRKFLPVFVTEEMVGHRLGEMAPTRFFKGHGAAHTKEATALT
ncbi:MAG TPA: 30S ribosomal protein S19 [Elusimicrobiota bacterium]|nr:30S ribosomal protein S19 [Elusimicrobiota bacterium]